MKRKVNIKYATITTDKTLMQHPINCSNKFKILVYVTAERHLCSGSTSVCLNHFGSAENPDRSPKIQIFALKLLAALIHLFSPLR